MSKLYCSYCMNELKIDSNGLCKFCGMNPKVGFFLPSNIQGVTKENIIKYNHDLYKSKNTFSGYGGQNKGIYGSNIDSKDQLNQEEINELIKFGNNFISFVIFIIISLGIFYFKIPFLVKIFLKILAILKLPVLMFLIT